MQKELQRFYGNSIISIKNMCSKGILFLLYVPKGIKYCNLYFIGTTNNGTYDTYFGESGNENIEDVIYNTSAVSESPVGKIIQKISYTPVTEPEYNVLRREATLKCLNAKVERKPCDPAGDFILIVY